MLACMELRIPFLDRAELIGCSLVLAELCDPVFETTDYSIMHVVTKRLSHEFGASAVFTLTDALKLGRHLGRQ